jgi:sec-independent protein translocase protein TatC
MVTGWLRGARKSTPSPGLDGEPGVMTLGEHLIELRDRLIHTAIAVVITCAICGVFIERIMGILTGMAGDTRLLALAPTEMFITYFKVAVFSGIALAMPVIIYELLAFLAPALTKKEKKYIFLAIPFVMIAFVCGLIFGYYIVIPSALRFLLHFGESYADIRPSMGEYFSFITTFLLAVGLVFETPIVIFFLAKLNIVSVKRLTKMRKFVVLGVFVVAAIITPTPDPFNQIIVAVPMYLLFEIGILLARLA